MEILLLVMSRSYGWHWLFGQSGTSMYQIEFSHIACQGGRVALMASGLPTRVAELHSLRRVTPAKGVEQPQFFLRFVIFNGQRSARDQLE